MIRESLNIKKRNLGLDIACSISDALDGEAKEDIAGAMELLESRITSFVQGIIEDLDKEYTNKPH